MLEKAQHRMLIISKCHRPIEANLLEDHPRNFNFFSFSTSLFCGSGTGMQDVDTSAVRAVTGQ